ncbi:hypothetical protein VTN31DRAFT_1569 [Thermomyces dupontii]|uniref:uncharacterized protein n=1 Tax=Talaromyces thermophilus TaxID=28565 RepID=UPI0037447B19
MGGKKFAENSKKAAGNARKAEAAARKAAAEEAKRQAEEDAKWEIGAKSNKKKEMAEAKKAEAARKKAERDALLAAEEASLPSKAKGAGAKTAQKKHRGLDLSQLDDDPLSKKAPTLNATGIENALDALEISTGPNNIKVDRHPERRYKAAYAAYEARRLPEIEKEHPGLRRQQRIEICKKEFEKSEENPFNKVHVAYDATHEEIAAVREAERRKIENRLAAK